MHSIYTSVRGIELSRAATGEVMAALCLMVNCVEEVALINAGWAAAVAGSVSIAVTQTVSWTIRQQQLKQNADSEEYADCVGMAEVLFRHCFFLHQYLQLPKLQNVRCHVLATDGNTSTRYAMVLIGSIPKLSHEYYISALFLIKQMELGSAPMFIPS